MPGYQPNDIVGKRYKIIKKIGQGGTAEIYQALDISSQDKVAIKIAIADSKVSSGLERFRNEYRLLSRFNNANIIKVLDYISDEEDEAMVIEYVDGQTLKQLIKSKGVISLTNSVYFTKQILSSLQDIHDKNIYHRDLKPQNVMVAYSGAVKLLDFGIAKQDAEDGLTKTGKVVGSVQYLSPEVLRGEKPSIQSDIYAVGMILFELLAGETAYKGSNPGTVASQIVNSELPDIRNINATIDDALVAIINKSLAKKPEQRYISSSQMIEDLVRWSQKIKTIAEEEEETRGSASKGSLTEQFEVYKKSKKMMIVATGLALTAIAAIVLVVLLVI